MNRRLLLSAPFMVAALVGCATAQQAQTRVVADGNADAARPAQRARLVADEQPARSVLSGRVLFIVDKSVFPAVQAGLETYAAHIQQEFGVRCEARPDDYYNMTPPQIRKILHEEYDTSDPALLGAIMVGPIPHACRSHDPNEIMTPCPLFYEDFDAVYVDKNNDGAYSDEEITNDRVHNPTEIWVSWWVPPALDADTQIKDLQFFLDKLDRYYKGEITGRDDMLWTAGNVVKVEDVEAWSVLMKDTLQPLGQTLKIWSKIGQDTGTFRPNKRKDEHSPSDFLKAFTLQPWQHAHIIAHGNQRGWYWDNTGVCFARAAGSKPESEWSLLIKLDELPFAGANIITTSGCSNGNFRGDYTRVAYDCAMPNILLFSDRTNTIAYFGAAAPQSTSGFACMATELVEALKSDGGSYFAEGYYQMKNHDYSWGLQHYFFRGGDEKVLLGDPFARYRDSKPFSAEMQADVAKKIQSAKWEEAGEW